MLHMSNLTFYKFLFIIALLIAESMFLFRLKRKPHFPLRLAVSTIFMLLFVAGFPVLAYNAIYSSLMFTVFFAVTVFTTRLCYDISWKSSLFCTIAGYSTQHLASVCYGLISTLGGFEYGTQMYSSSRLEVGVLPLLVFAEVYALVYWCIFGFFGKKICKEEAISIRSPAMLVLLVVTVLVEIVLNAAVTYRSYENLDVVYYVSASMVNIVCSLAVLIIQFTLMLQKTLEDELNIVNQMWHQEQKQYEISKQTIDLINMKCHDMKHQIHSISRQTAIDPQVLREMEQTISIYDSIVKTGNQALDIILAEKSLYCQNNDIFISCMVDGKKLSFMSDSDIYSLFGNILDNAIQSVLNLERDHRVIGITVRAEEELLSVNSHNYYAGSIRMEGGLPVTSNRDRTLHGFGVKSMVMIVEKYGGTISFDAKDQIFNLNILFPISGGTGTV